VTAYAASCGSAVENAKEPLAVSFRSLPPLSCRTTLPSRPEIVPPTVYKSAPQLTTMLVTSADPTTPVAPETLQACEGDVGCVAIVTE